MFILRLLALFSLLTTAVGDSVTTDSRCSGDYSACVDPNGGRAALQTDAGCGIDPNGCPDTNGGGAMDPNG